MAKNIEMNIKEQSNYEILYPKTLSEQVINLLNNDTKELMGLTEDATPDDAFKDLFYGVYLGNKAAIELTVKDSEGYIFSNTAITCPNFVDKFGATVDSYVTDNNGKATVLATPGNITMTLGINYINYPNKILTMNSIEAGKTYNQEWVLTRNTGTIQISSSQNIVLSPQIVRVDVAGVGGGGGGSGAASRDSWHACGGGGGGGYASIVENVMLDSDKNLSITIGTGGVGGQAVSGYGGGVDVGGNGGSTIVSYKSNNILTAQGGGGGKAKGSVLTTNNRGLGNGNGGNGGYAGVNYGEDVGRSGNSASTNNVWGSNCGGGGGGGTNSRVITTGGYPNGGEGGARESREIYNEPENGKTPGGGGGGGYASSTPSHDVDDPRGPGANGGAGMVYIKTYTS